MSYILHTKWEHDDDDNSAARRKFTMCKHKIYWEITHISFCFVEMPWVSVTFGFI